MRRLFESLHCRNTSRPVRALRGAESRSAAERLEQRCLLSADSLLPDLDSVSDVTVASPDVALNQNVSTAWFEGGSVALDADSPADRWIVRLTAAATDQSGSVAGAQELLASAGVQAIVVRGLGLPGMLLVAPQSSQTDLPAALAGSRFVEYFTRDLSVEAQTLVPDDTDFAANQYSFDNTGQFFGTSNADINAPEAWDLFPESDLRPGSHDVVVAVIDSGVEYTHPDLARNIWINQGEIPTTLRDQLEDTDVDGLITFVDLNQVANSAFVTDGNGNGFIDGGDLLSDAAWENGSDDDGNGLTDDLIGWDFLNNDNDPFDDHRHGTHVAGTIGAVGDNGLGVSGVNWDVSIMALKFLNTQLTGSTSDAILAINYATLMRSQFDTNVRVMNASWGTLGDFNPDLQDALTAAQTADILFVAASGNGDVTGRGVDLDNDLGFYPASFDLENIIAVAASDNSDNLARFSNFGATSVDLAAPGVGIFGLNLGGGLIFRTGTSMATPHVTGTVALLAALRPFAIASEIRDAIIDSVRTVGGLSGKVATGGTLNAAAALNIDTFAPLAQFAIDGNGDVVPPPDITTDGGTTQDIFVRYEDDTLLDVSTLDAGDLIVRKQDDGAEFPVSFQFGPNSNIAIATAGYRMTAPGGTWLLEDNGIYEVILQAGEVSDTGGRFSREAVIGSFEVAIAFAGQINVTTTSDGIAAGTLRAAVQAANAEAGLNTIALRTGETYTLDISGSGEDAAATGDLDITDAAGLVIRGNGAIIEIVGGVDRVFDVQASGALTLLDVTIKGGSVTGSTPGGDGGGVRNNGGTLTIERSLLTANTATKGGALASSGTTTIINTTISDNTATNGGGIDHTSGTLLVSSVTVANNAATSSGGGIRSSANAQLENTIVADNTADTSDADTSGTFTSNGHNLIGTVGTATGLTNGTNGDQVGSSGTPVAALLGELKDNGGFTFTHRLLPGSPAIDAGDNALAPDVDQRSAARPIDSLRTRTPTVDIGAHERNLVDIEGLKFLDANRNGVRDEGEPGLPGWTIYLDLNENGQLDPNEPRAVTVQDDSATSGIDEAGSYRFAELQPREYIVREQLQPGWELTTPLQVEGAVIALSTLDGTTGFRLDGIDAGDRSGHSVSSAGDVNGDGFDDLIIGTRYVGSHVVFGKSSGFASAIDLSTLDGTTGFRLDGMNSRVSVSSAGDVNGDGFDDLIIGAPNANSLKGESYVVFGKSGGFGSAVDLTTLDGTTGFRLDGINDNDRAGHSVSSAGDVNGDGFDDLIIGAFFANSGKGESYVVFGKSGGFASSLDLSTLDGVTGFRLDGIDGYDRSGASVSNAGDVNGDGFDDLIIGAPDADSRKGESYVVFGKSGGFAPAIDLSTLDGTTGFRLDGFIEDEHAPGSPYSGTSVSGAGDVNGDGFEDLIIGAPHGTSSGLPGLAGASYVVFGKSGGFSSVIDLSMLDGTTGFRLNGDFSDLFGGSVSGAGDVNGDGFDDLIIGASYASQSGTFRAGESYVVFGKSGGFAAAIDKTTLDGATGFRLDGINNDDVSGYSVSNAGDVNGDGFDDVIIGAPQGSNPFDETEGESYVVFGRETPTAVSNIGFWNVRLRAGNLASQVDFGNAPLDGEIAGRVFRDLNLNSLRDAGEAGLASWQVFLDEDEDNQLDAGETVVTTDSEGRYSFTGLTPLQTYRVVQMVQTGFEQTLPDPAGGPVIEVALGAGEERADVDFGNLDTVGGVGLGSGKLEGFYFVDANENGVLDAGEERAGITVYLDLNNNGALDSSGGNAEPSQVTSATGFYRFEQLAGGTYTVRSVNAENQEQQFPRNNSLSISDVDVGDFPQSIATGSFNTNTDSIPDLVVANVFTNDLSVLLRTGDSFTAAASVFTGSFQPRSVAVADFNQDGTDDLVVGHEATNIVSILIGQGDGTFGAPTILNMGGGQTTVSTGLFTNDAFPDIAVASAVSNQAFVISNTTGTNFSILHTVSTGSVPSRAEFANLEANLPFNANSDPDLVVTSFGENRVETYFNSGTGPLNSAVTANVGLSPSDMAVADFDGDGSLDVATANQFSDNVTVLFNNGTSGRFDTGRNEDYPAGSGPSAIEAVDMNVDGLLDLVVTNGSDSNLAVLYNLGDGVFQSPQNFGVGVFPVRLAWSVATADFDQDGDPDLAVAKGVSNQAAILDNTLIEGAYRVILTGDGDETISGLDFAVVEADSAPPTPVISSTESSPTNASPINVSIDFGEVVSGFVTGDLVVGNGAASSFATSDNRTYTFNVTPTADGVVTVDVAASAAQDTTGNNSVVATRFSITSDRTPPTPVITATQSGPTNASPINVSIDFGESVSGFVASDLVVSNGAVSSFATTDNRTYTFDVAPTADGAVTVDVAASAAQDTAGNNSVVATRFSITSDRTSPTPIITASQSSQTNESPLNVSVNFGEVVSGFVTGDLAVGNGTTSDFSTSDNQVFTFDVTPMAVGTVTVGIPAMVARDAAGNDNLQAVPLSVEFGSTQREILPTGGGTYELLVIDTDIILRRQAAEELLRLTNQPGLSIIIDGSTDDDVLIIDLSTLPGLGVTWNGGDGIDSLTVAGGSFDMTTITNSGAADGVIAFDGFPVAFTGLEPIDLTGVTSASMNVVLPDTSDNASLTPTGGGMLMLSSMDGTPTFEMVEFATPAGELRIDAGGGNDVVSAATVTTSVTLVGGPGDDVLTGGTADDILRGGEGTDQFDGGPGHDMIADRSDGETTNSTLITVDTRVVLTPTSTDPDGHVAELPSNVRYLDEWDDFTIEVWGSTPDDAMTSIGSFSVDVPFDGSFYEATAVEFGPAFTDSRQSTTDNVAGIVSGISASSLTADLGRVEFALMVRVSFQVLVGANLTNSATGRYILPTVDDRLTANGVMFDTAAGAESDSNEPAAPSIRIWPVMYDLDDSGEIGFGDVARFAQVFGNSTTTSDESYSRDFDRSGDVDFGDVALFAQNFGRSRASATQQSYALNFPNAWEPAALLANTASPELTASLASGQQPLSSGTLRGLQDAAIDRFEEAGLSDTELDALRSVDIRVQDLPDGYLGLATDDAIIVDIDANGAGWFVDDTPDDDREFAVFEQSAIAATAAARDRFDLLSVIAHELGHHAGWNHDDAGFMTDRLSSGERRLPQPTDTDEHFAAFSELDELLGF